MKHEACMAPLQYRFHGLSYIYPMNAPSRIGRNKKIKGRVILAHLENGASLAAVLGGENPAASMCVAAKKRARPRPPFNMAVLNDIDRFHLVSDVIDRVPQLGSRAEPLKQAIHDKLTAHKRYVAEHGEDLPEIGTWKWNGWD